MEPIILAYIGIGLMVGLPVWEVLWCYNYR